MAAPKKPAPKPKSDIPPPFDYAAERKKRAGESGNRYVPGTMKTKAPKPKKGGMTGMKTRRQLFKDAFGDY